MFVAINCANANDNVPKQLKKEAESWVVFFKAGVLKLPMYIPYMFKHCVFLAVSE